MSEDTPEVVELRIKAAVGEHEKECREAGPIAKLRQEVSELKGWAKVLTVALALVPLWLALGGWALTGYIGARIDKAMHGGQAHVESGLLIHSASAAEHPAQVQGK